MASGYTSWKCGDLNDAILYSSDVITNPDWYTSDDFCPLVRPYGFDIMSLFDADIAEAKLAGENFDSGVIKLARIFFNNTLTNTYMTFRVNYRFSDDKILITLSYTGYTRPAYEFDYTDYVTWPTYRKSIYILRKRNRTFLYADLPGYDNTYTYYLIFGAGVNIFTGVWTDATQSIPFKHMVYTNQGPGNPTYCLLSIPCASDNEESRSQQSEGVFKCAYNISYYNPRPDFHFTDYEGNYTDDAEEPPEYDPNTEDPEGPSGPGGGQGTHDRRNDIIGLPSLPGLGALDGGMITLYKLTAADMANFFSDMWTFWQGIKSYFADPLDFIMGCMIMPFSPFTNGRYFPKFGTDTWNYSFLAVSQQYFNLSLGMIDIDKYYDSCFDWDPYQKIQIFIPYVGYRELPVDQVNGKTIQLTYHIDCMSGEFVAFIHTPNTSLSGKPQIEQIICQFAGTMGVRIPLHRQSFDNMVSAGINLLGGAVGMVAGGLSQAAGLEGGNLNSNQIASQASAATVSAVNAGKRNVIRSGSIGSDAGYIGSQRPFIIRTLPRQSLPVKYMELEGYPCNMYGPVSDFTGFVAVETIKLRVNCTEPEKEMIEQLMKGGIYI